MINSNNNTVREWHCAGREAVGNYIPTFLWKDGPPKVFKPIVVYEI
jgi:hypothetical protein